MASYDLEAHVQRVLAREREWAWAHPPKAPAQLTLFDMEPRRDRPPDRYKTPDGLVVDDELLFSRVVSDHSIAKAYLARFYADIVGVAMKTWKLWWIELFSGPGRLFVRETEEYMPGSPLEALAIRRRFDGYVFSDLANPCVESLRRRVAGRPNVHVLRGDANSPELLVELAKIVPKRALVVLYGDPAGLDLRWGTLQFFIDRYRYLDLLLNLPVSGVVRALSAGYEQKAGSLLDHPAPRSLLAEADSRVLDRGSLVRDWYTRRLAAAGFDQIDGATIRLTRTGVPLYDLLMASRNPLAPKFLREAIASHERHREAALAG